MGHLAKQWLLALSLSLSLTTHVAAQAQDLILHNGKIATVDARFSIASALAIRGDRIVAVGSNEDVRKLAGPSTVQRDLAQRTVIPGLIDNHMHFLRTALLPGLDMRELESAFTVAEALRRIKDRAGKAPRDAWLSALGGVRESQFEEKRFPTLAELDGAAPDHPVYLSISNSGPGSVNRSAKAFLEAKGVKVAADGTIAAGPDTISAGRVLAPLFSGHEEIKRATQRQMATALGSGLTTIADHGGTIPEGGYLDPATGYEPMLELMREGKVPLRIRLFLPIMETEPELPLLKGRLDNALRDFGNDMVRVVGFGEWLVDRKFQTMNPLPEFYERGAKLAAKRGRTYQQHVINLREIRAHLDVWERVNAETPIAPLRWSLMHLYGMDDESIARAKKLGIGVMPHATPYYNPIASAGPKPPFRSLIEAGIANVGAGSDGARIATLNPWPMIYYMVTGRNAGNQLINADQTVTREQALRLYTASNGWFFRDEHLIGSIEPGKLADLAILSADYLDAGKVPDAEIRNLRALITFVGGKIVHGSL